ncbi:hypothetical protein [Paludibaculum fermentans]|uniref:hypothetical protein n=1 Tax=Paludibaculum fermentans TaxID=1473598 RepID=UPI003EB87373
MMLPEMPGRKESMPTQIKRDPAQSRPRAQQITERLLLAAGQLLVAGVAAILWQFIANALGWGESWQYPLAPATPQIIDATMISILGFCLAWWVVGLLPGAAAAGRWVWLPPAVLLVLLIGRDILRSGWDWHLISSHYFWAYPAQKVSPIERDILTYPVLSAIAYSLGARSRSAKSPAGGDG